MALGRYGEAHRHASEASALADKEPISEVEKAQIRLVRQNTSLALVFRFFFFGILVAIALHIAWHAGKCGYPPLLWIAAGLLSGLPMANLAVLASLRDLRLEKERVRLRREVMQLVALSQSSRP